MEYAKSLCLKNHDEESLCTIRTTRLHTTISMLQRTYDQQGRSWLLTNHHTDNFTQSRIHTFHTRGHGSTSKTKRRKTRSSRSRIKCMSVSYHKNHICSAAAHDFLVAYSKPFYYWWEQSKPTETRADHPSCPCFSDRVIYSGFCTWIELVCPSGLMDSRQIYACEQRIDSENC